MFSGGHVFGIDNYRELIVHSLLEVRPVLRQITGEGLNEIDQVREEIVPNDRGLLVPQPLFEKFEFFIDSMLIALRGAVIIIGQQP